MRVRFAALLVLLCTAAPQAGRAQDPYSTYSKPKWEIGVIGGGALTPDYPGSDQHHAHPLILPWLIYRGDVLYSDERGPAARLLNLQDLKFDISVSGSFPAHSNNDNARQGMPNLDYIGEIGPRLEWTIARAARDAKLLFELPVRAAISTDLHSRIDFRGFVAAPELAYQNDNFFQTNTRFKLGFLANFATGPLMDYFYQVDQPFATPTRPAFDAHGGYLGSSIHMTLIKTFSDRFKGILLTRYDFLHGAENDASPLFRKDTNFTIGIGLAVSLFVSDERQPVD